MTRLRIGILLLICLVGVGILLTIRFSRTGDEGRPLRIEIDADLTSKNIRLVGDKSGFKEWELEAKFARHFQERKTTTFEDIEAAFYIEKGGLIRLKGDRGKLYHGTKDIELQGNVVIFTTDGYRLTTDGLNFVNEERQIRSSERVDIAGNGLEITGRGMSIDLVTGKLSMGGRVDTIFSGAFKGWKGMVPR